MMKNLLILLTAMTSFAWADSPLSHYEYKLEAIAYNKTPERIYAHFFLDNGYEFIYANTLEKEHILLDIENELPIGSKVDIKRWSFSSSLMISTKEGPTCYKIAISKETKSNLPKIIEIKSNPGWIYNECLITLSDGTVWNYNVKKLSNNFVNYWKVGNAVFLQKKSDNAVRMINVNAPYEYTLGDYYHDFREIEATPVGH